MKHGQFKPLVFMGIDFTPSRRYRNEIALLERLNNDLYNSFASSEKDRCDILRKCAEERYKRLACEKELERYRRKRGENGRFVKG